jgi:hypothetical protein
MAPIDRRHFGRLAAASVLAPAALARAASNAGVAIASSKPQWRSLFDGKSLDGWTPKIRYFDLGDNYKNTFRVEDGLIKVRYDGYDDFGEKFGHLFFKESFSKYRLRVEYRFVGEQAKGGPGWALRNSGAMIHCQDPKSMLKDQDFPVSIEVQYLGGDGRSPRTTCNLCTPGTNVVMEGKLVTQHCYNSKSPTFHGDQWVTAEVEILGDGLVKHLVNGQPVLSYEKPQYDPRDKYAKPLIKGENLLISSGYISLQAESHPIDFRKVEIMVLD